MVDVTFLTGAALKHTVLREHHFPSSGSLAQVSEMGLLTYVELPELLFTFLVKTVDSIGFNLLLSRGIDSPIDSSEAHLVEMLLNSWFLDILAGVLVNQAVVVKRVLNLHGLVVVRKLRL